MAGHVAGDGLRELADEHGPLGSRADEAHVATDDVRQLWQLVEAQPSQQAPLSTLSLARLIHEAGCPPGVLKGPRQQLATDAAALMTRGDEQFC